LSSRYVEEIFGTGAPGSLDDIEGEKEEEEVISRMAKINSNKVF